MTIDRGRCRRELREAPASEECVQGVHMLQLAYSFAFSPPAARSHTPYRSIYGNITNRIFTQTGLVTENREWRISISPTTHSICKGLKY